MLCRLGLPKLALYLRAFQSSLEKWQSITAEAMNGGNLQQGPHQKSGEDVAGGSPSFRRLREMAALSMATMPWRLMPSESSVSAKIWGLRKRIGNWSVGSPSDFLDGFAACLFVVAFSLFTQRLRASGFPFKRRVEKTNRTTIFLAEISDEM